MNETNSTYEMTAYERALTSIIKAFYEERYDDYDRLIETTARRFGRTANMVEDDSTDLFMFGPGANDFSD